jgi:hypothetical protein
MATHTIQYPSPAPDEYIGSNEELQAALAPIIENGDTRFKTHYLVSNRLAYILCTTDNSVRWFHCL